MTKATVIETIEVAAAAVTAKTAIEPVEVEATAAMIASLTEAVIVAVEVTETVIASLTVAVIVIVTVTKIMTAKGAVKVEGNAAVEVIEAVTRETVPLVPRGVAVTLFLIRSLTRNENGNLDLLLSLRSFFFLLFFLLFADDDHLRWSLPRRPHPLPPQPPC